MTPKEQAVMQQALEALEACVEKFYAMKSTGVIGALPMQAVKAAQAITALREALAEQAEQEPVGVVTKDSLDGVVKWNGWIPREGTKLYAAPVQQVTRADIKAAFKEGFERAADLYAPKDVQDQAAQEPVASVEDWPTDSTPKGIVALCDIKELPAGALLYASPAISTEVFTREKVDSLLIAAYTKGRNDLLEKQAEQEPVMGYEHLNALREGEQNGAEDAYFFVRPENDTPTLRKMFCQGFERGFHKGLKYAAPVRTKDLTDDEIAALWASDGFYRTPTDFARAIIAAYEEKQK